MNDAPLLISSARNPRLADAIRLRDRSERLARGCMLVEGQREITRAIDAGHRPTELFYCRARIEAAPLDAILKRAGDGGASLLECTEAAFDRLAYRQNPEGVVAIMPLLTGRLQELAVPDNALLVVAESVEKPGNLGAILRSCDAVGAHGVIVCDAATDIHNPNVIRASLGTIFSRPVLQASSAETIVWLRREGVRICAAIPDASQLYWSADLTGRVAFVLGAEDKGLSRAWHEAADARLRLPMHGQADSLNVSVAAAVLLFEALRQRQ